jgi:hypothetical protein
MNTGLGVLDLVMMAGVEEPNLVLRCDSLFGSGRRAV